MKPKILFLSLLPVFSVNAATLAYYQFDDAVAGTNASNLASEFNAPTRNGTASTVGTGAVLPKFSSVTPGSVITNGIGGSIFNGSNTTSLEFFNGAGGTADPAGSIGGKVTIDGTTTFNAASFTMEAFIKVDTFVPYTTIFAKQRSSGGIAWQMDTDASGKTRARFDTVGTEGSGNQVIAGGTISDGLWHHVALTYDSMSATAKLYLDYNQVGISEVIEGDLALDGGSLVIGAGGAARTFDGLIDEVRYTDSALTTSDFLRAVPEPSSTLLVIGTACLSLLVRKRY